MGKYNFDEVIDRHGTDCLKYDFGMKRKGRDDLLPLWVADMDFRLPDEILDEFHKRIDHGIFGYTDPLDDYFDAMNHWFSTRYGYTIDSEWVTLGAGIVYALGTSVRAFTEEGDTMMVMQPVYYPFSEVIKNDGHETTADAAKAARESGADVVVICSTDDTYPELVPPLAKELKETMPHVTVILAGAPPKDLEPVYREAGVDDFISVRANCYEILNTLQDKKGM